MSRCSLGAASRAVLAGLALGAAAQAAFAQPIAQPTYGPPLAGICVFDRGAALGRSQAGQSVDQQLAQFAQGVKAELGAERAAIVADDKALAQRRASTPPAQYQQDVAALNQRYAALDRTSAERRDQLDRTSKDAADLISRSMLPALGAVITQRKCSLVVDTGALIGGNPAMNITGEVIQRLDQRLPSVTVRLAPPRS